ncbi:hypothetical protein O9992_12230 [Vibrio lentus]|nr:hypothetical protein [Vibrio lentus]
MVWLITPGRFMFALWLANLVINLKVMDSSKCQIYCCFGFLGVVSGRIG